ncbi:uncharacterized protein LOC128318421 [Pangasianodon hypophthalmus]|uniref:uncharacterized protein LOC128318421 n=1 Tax=Pangasianodon hypophthalmus TaxID=310915 RepID=UPI0023071878|nr:uncharacterized protein LOC128318421 [Pangasianodon hypophthalmus]
MARVIEMDNLPFAIICTPFCVCATVLNVFFIFCLCKPAAGVNVRQPLYLLLTAVLGNSIVQQLIAMISVVLSFLSPPDWLLVVNVAIIFQTYCSSFSINAWISIFYYMKIVPQHWKIFIWVKKNMKAIVFAGFLFDQTLLTSALSVGTASTYFYLRRHIKRMEQTTGSSSHPQQKNHMRVTVMGIVQAALFIPTSLYAMVMALLFSTLYETLDNNKHITMTIVSISNLANISCLGFSQSVFRLRVIALLKRVKKAFGLMDQT